MKIWLVTIGEPLPTDRGSPRLLRAGLIANFCLQQGYDVVWWTSTFDHTKKEQRYSEDTIIRIHENYKLIFLHSPAYQSNISVQRIVNHFVLARKFKKLSKREKKPDIVLSSFPTIELSLAATEYGLQYDIPVVLDIRDLWPDIFVNLAPASLQKLTRVLLSPFFKITKDAFHQASAIFGITPYFVKWGIEYAGRSLSEFDRDFPLGYSINTPKSHDIVRAETFWQEQGVSQERSGFIICFFGTFGRQVALETIIDAALLLEEKNTSVLFVLCGTGDTFNHYSRLAETKKCSNIIFPGWVDQAEIWTLMRLSSVGIAPYYSTLDFSMSIPNKVIEYLSAGLPILSSLQGIVKKLFSEYQCGMTYHHDDAGELVQCIIDLRNSPQVLTEMKQNSHALFHDKFVAEKVYRDMISHLEFIYKSKNG